MKKNLLASIAIAPLVFLTLANANFAKADIIGVSLGYRFDPSLIAIDFLVPLKHHGQKRPKGPVLDFGVHILGGLSLRGEGRTNLSESDDVWIGFSIPVAYEHVFNNGISLIVGAEFNYSSYKTIFVSSVSSQNNSIISFNETFIKEITYGGGIVVGTNYFFKSGVFLGLRVASGVNYEEKSSKNTINSNRNTENTRTYHYAAPILSVGYMF